MSNKIEIPDDPEIVVAVSFINKYRNLLIGGVLLIAIVLVGKIWWDKNREETRKLAADKLFLVKVDFDNRDYEKVIKDGKNQIEKFSSYPQSGEMMLLIAKSYLATNKEAEAVKMLEECASSFKSDDLLYFSANNMLGIITLDKAVLNKDKAAAEQAAAYFDKAAASNQEIFADQCRFNSAKALLIAEKKDKAKEILTALDKKEELSYSLKDKTKKLLETL